MAYMKGIYSIYVAFVGAFVVVVLSYTLCFAPSRGVALYLEYCSQCHGSDGEGGRGAVLKKEGFLVTVDEDYLVKTMRFGRPTRGCPSFEGKLSREDMMAIALYIKSWQKGELLPAPTHSVEPRYTRRGEEIFILCGGCHGLEGEGAMGPPLLDPGLLKSATDTVLRRTIMHGRPGTPMKGYLEGKGGLAVLTPREIDLVIAYIRYREKNME